jgi:RNA polymerase sigma-70 factor, ECF subfamily
VEQSDWELVRQCKSGDRQAFRELVERYQRKTMAIAFGILHDREDAQEIAQEAFAKVFTSIQKFKEEASFYTWLYRITVNLAIDRQRQKNRQPLLERTDQGEGENARIESIPDTNEADPYEKLKDQELAERIRSALAELTPAHKAVILLREIEGLSYEEISEVLQCSRGTVMSRLHYARKKLQSRLRHDL